MKPQNSREHVDYQRCYFDENVNFFRQPIPAEIQERTREIVRAAALAADNKVLDVGTGIGVLIPYFMENGVVPSAITGCDLSSEMLAEAQKRYPAANFWQGDLLEFPLNYRLFDAIFFNACFGNFFDQLSALEHCVKLLLPKGQIVISHPLGNPFVAQLKAQDPRLVLKLLPNEAELTNWCKLLDVELKIFRDEDDFYLAILRKSA